MVFGVISPKRRISTVRIPLAIATMEPPKPYARLSGEGGGGQIDDVVADQDSAEHLCLNRR